MLPPALQMQQYIKKRQGIFASASIPFPKKKTPDRHILTIPSFFMLPKQTPKMPVARPSHIDQTRHYFLYIRSAVTRETRPIPRYDS